MKSRLDGHGRGRGLPPQSSGLFRDLYHIYSQFTEHSIEQVKRRFRILATRTWDSSHKEDSKEDRDIRTWDSSHGEEPCFVSV